MTEIGFILSGDQTEKLVDLCIYMDKDPYELIADAIDRLYAVYLEQVGNDG